jgi:hypothetical protein
MTMINKLNTVAVVITFSGVSARAQDVFSLDTTWQRVLRHGKNTVAAEWLSAMEGPPDGRHKIKRTITLGEFLHRINFPQLF